MKFFISKNKKLPAAAQKGLQPGKEFMTQGRERFLAAFDASELSRNAHGLRGATRPAYVTAFFKIGVGVLAVLCVGIGLSAYADTANVGATNPLYPLKRLGENVQLALAPASEKSQLQATFAVRRANEIAALQVSAPSSTLIPALTSALDQDIDTSLSALANNSASDTGASVTAGVQSGNGRGPYHGSGIRATSSGSSTASVTTGSSSVNIGPIDVYCNAFNLSTSGILIGHLEATLAAQPNGFTDFNEQCNDLHDQENSGASSIGTTSVDQSHHGYPLMGGNVINASDTTTQTPSTEMATSTASIHVSIPKIGL